MSTECELGEFEFGEVVQFCGLFSEVIRSNHDEEGGFCIATADSSHPSPTGVPSLAVETQQPNHFGPLPSFLPRSGQPIQKTTA